MRLTEADLEAPENNKNVWKWGIVRFPFLKLFYWFLLDLCWKMSEMR